jgi:hypothetical protein
MDFADSYRNYSLMLTFMAIWLGYTRHNGVSGIESQTSNFCTLEVSFAVYFADIRNQTYSILILCRHINV